LIMYWNMNPSRTVERTISLIEHQDNITNIKLPAFPSTQHDIGDILIWGVSRVCVQLALSTSRLMIEMKEG
jgi:hypothetical protein